MNALTAYVSRPFKMLKDEVLVLPGRTVVLLVCLGLLLFPLISREPFILRVLILASIFAVLAASWDLLSGFTGQINFGHALFFGVAAYTAAVLNMNLGLAPVGHHPPGRCCCGPGGSDRGDTLPEIAGHIPGLCHTRVSLDLAGRGIRHSQDYSAVNWVSTG